MKVLLSNLAHVKEAELTDQRLTIIVGDNGAGKTLLLETVSFIKEFYQKKKNSLISRFIKKYEEQIKVDIDFQNIGLKAIEETKTFKVELALQNLDSLNNGLQKMVEDEYENVIHGVNENVLLTNDSKFSFKLLNLNFFEIEDKASFTIHMRGRNHSELILALKQKDKIISSSLIRNTFLVKDNDQSLNDEKLFQVIDNNALQELIVKEVKEMFISYHYKRYFGSERILYLPSERNLLMDNALLKAASDLEMETNLKRRYSDRLFTSSYLKFKHYVEVFPDLVNKYTSDIERLFGGKIRYSNDGEVISILMDNGIEIRRELFSTKQNRLIPYLLINQPILPYEEVIIEEPEAHLSLKSQKEFLSYLKSLLENDRRKFFITTHSDVFFSFLNNLLLENPSIQVNVYELIEKDAGTFFLIEKEKTEFGYEIDMFTNILNELYDETLKIQEKNNS